MRIFSSAVYCRRVARRMSHMAFSALSFFFVIIVPLLSYDEPNVSLIQTTQLVRVLLTGNIYQVTRSGWQDSRLKCLCCFSGCPGLWHPPHAYRSGEFDFQSIGYVGGNGFDGRFVVASSISGVTSQTGLVRSLSLPIFLLSFAGRQLLSYRAWLPYWFLFTPVETCQRAYLGACL